MSLLLKALKKAEENSDEKEISSESSSSSAATPVAITSAGSDVAEGAEASSGASLGGGLGSESDISGSEEEKKREQVDAARVFGASEKDEEIVRDYSGVRRFAVVAVFVALLGGGGYAAVIGGFFPGIDILGLLGLQQEEIVEQRAEPNIAAQLQKSEDISLLPTPAIDVQAGIDFADLNNFLSDETRGGENDFNKEEYRRKIAVLTGYDINKEIQRRKEEEEALIRELSQGEDSDVGVADDDLDSTEETEEKVIVTYTAKASRATKLRLDSKTFSDKSLEDGVSSSVKNKKIASLEENLANAIPATPAESNNLSSGSAVSQVEINISLDGQERKNLLRKARENYYKGAYTDAEAIYREILRASPTNRNALRGLAMVAVATRRYQMAAATYLDILSFYPNDAVAISELTNLRGGNKENFYAVEKILKGLIGKNPEADDRIYFSLGNLYAEAGRWPDAQKFYFEALSHRTDNADYAYNLAVVLDYLNKPELAVRYYQQALSLSEGVSVGFDASEARARINDLANR